MRPLRCFLAHLPILASAAISLAFSSDVLRSFRDERTHAWLAVVLLSLAVLLAFVQLAIWLVWARRRLA